MIRFVRVAPIAGAALASIILLVQSWVALTSGYDVNLVSGVWLTLALDARDGLFYRALVQSGEYGGTRYFPLLFLLITGWMRAGISAIPAGQLASVLGGAVLATGAFRFLTRLGVARPLALSGSVLALAPYFVQQSIFAIRAEPLAAGLALWGASFVAERLGDGGRVRWALYAAAAFGLAAAAKPTSIYAGVAAMLALACAGRRRDAARLALLSVAAWGLLIAAIWIGSDGRAIESFRACALAGETPLELISLGALLRPLQLVSASNYLTAVLTLVAAALIGSPGDALRLPGWLVILAALAAATALATPGTILVNQILEPYVAGALYLVWVAHTRVRLRTAGHVLVAALLVWASSYNARRVATLTRDDAGVKVSTERAALVAAVERCGRSLLAESPLVPILAGRRPILLDPFAFRVAAMKQPAMAEDLIARLRAREFACVVLEMDPESERGRGWYRNVHLGAPVIEALLKQYDYRESIGGRRFYTPRPRGAAEAPFLTGSRPSTSDRTTPRPAAPAFARAASGHHPRPRA